MCVDTQSLSRYLDLSSKHANAIQDILEMKKLASS